MSLPGISGRRLWRKRSLSILGSSPTSRRPRTCLTSAGWRKARRSGAVLRTSLPRSVTRSAAALMDLSATTAKQVSVGGVSWGALVHAECDQPCCCLASDRAVYQRWPVCGGGGPGRDLASHGGGLDQPARHERALLRPCGLHRRFRHLPVPCDGVRHDDERGGWNLQNGCRSLSVQLLKWRPLLPLQEDGYIVYENHMSSSYEVGIGPRGSITRDSHFEWVLTLNPVFWAHRRISEV